MSDLFVVPHLADQVDRAAKAVFRDEYRLARIAVAEIADLLQLVRAGLIGMLVGQHVFPLARAGIAQAADRLRLLVNRRSVKLERGRIGLRARGKPAV